MRAYTPSMGTRPLLGLILTIAVLFASALSGSAAASAATVPGHDMQMMEMGHCSSMPSKDDGKTPVKSCCVAMCMAAVAVAPSAPAELPMVQRAQPASFVPAAHDGYLGEIATPPPRLA